MTRIVWLFGWVGVGVWSLLCAAAYGLFDVVGRFSMRNADAWSSDPGTVESIWRVLNVVHSLSTGAVVITWAVVSLLILAVPWVLDRLIGSSAGPTVVRRSVRTGTGTPFGPRDEGVIDLSPDQYSVRPGASPSTGGTTPRIPPGR